jgi:hypothetical protein
MQVDFSQLDYRQRPRNQSTSAPTSTASAIAFSFVSP